MKKGRFSKHSLFTISILLLSAGLTFGRTITVGIGLGYDYSTIQPAIDAAHNGDTVIVAQGEYTGSVYFKGKSIVLTSTENNNWDVIQKTIITTDHGSVITFSGNESPSCTLLGVTIVNGSAAYGGGVNGNGTKATIRRCYIHSNDAIRQGGGLYDCDGLIDDCWIRGNNAGSRLDFGKGAGLCGCDGTIKNCDIKNNSSGKARPSSFSDEYHGDGGGLYGCNAKIIDCTIENNFAAGNGGGLYNCNATITDCIINNNKSGYDYLPGSGGGLYNCNADINNCTIQNNTATNKGGGLYSCNGIISGCTIENNTTTSDSGGGLSNCMGFVVDCNILGNTSPLWHAGGAIDCNSFTNCIISGNSARGYGGGLYNCKRVDRCTISGNSSEIYPGAGLADCNFVTNCIISGNTAGGSGGGLYDCNEIVNCTIVGNYSNVTGGGVFFDREYGTIDNTIIWDNMASQGGQVSVGYNKPGLVLWDLSIDYSDVQGGENGVILSRSARLKWEPNNIDIYPLFKHPGNWTTQNNQKNWNEGDYHLLQSSPCIDTGDPNRNYADQNDIDGDARLIGLRVDIGADEAHAYIPPAFVQLEITGPHQVTEGDSAQYVAVGRYDDDSQVVLTNEVTWAVEPQNVGIVDANGLFTPGALNESTEVTVRATYTPEDQQVVYVAEMTIVCVPAGTKYYVDGETGNDLNDGLSRLTALKTINAGIEAAQDGDTVLVYPGLYREAVIFWGKKITLRSADDAAVIENPGNIAVLFCFDESAESTIQNFVVRNSKMGILNVLGSSPTIKNLTIVNNENGIECFDSEPNIGNCILWDNSDKDFINCMPTYSCTEDTYVISAITTDLNIHSNPLFADSNEGNYHLKSQYGRYSPVSDTWVFDNETSPCIDAGNPEDNYSNEPEPNGRRINMGAYGGTSKASLSSVSDILNKASNPNPSNGSLGVNTKPTLAWTAGFNAVSHDVYIGTDNASVSNATRANPLGVLASQGQSTATYTTANYLSYNQIYFWRIDEVGSSGSITKGDTWTFITQNSGKGRSCFVGNVPVWISGKKSRYQKRQPDRVSAYLLLLGDRKSTDFWSTKEPMICMISFSIAANV